MSKYGPEDSELAGALREIASKAVLEGGRNQRVLIVGMTGDTREVRAVISTAELRRGTHLSRLREVEAEDDFSGEAILHIGFRNEGFVYVHLLEHGDSLYRLRVPDPPKKPRWVAVSDLMRRSWDRTWGGL